jgi:hypothetical protein
MCLARELTLRGRRVRLLHDPFQPVASRAAAGLLQVAGGRISSSHLALRRACCSFYPTFLSSLDSGLQMLGPGHLRLGEDPRAIHSFASTLRGLRVAAEALEGEELRALEPALSSVEAAVRLPDAVVDVETLLASLRGWLDR